MLSMRRILQIFLPFEEDNRRGGWDEEEMKRGMKNGYIFLMSMWYIHLMMIIPLFCSEYTNC